MIFQTKKFHFKRLEYTALFILCFEMHCLAQTQSNQQGVTDIDCTLYLPGRRLMTGKVG